MSAANDTVPSPYLASLPPAAVAASAKLAAEIARNDADAELRALVLAWVEANAVSSKASCDGMLQRDRAEWDRLHIIAEHAHGALVAHCRVATPRTKRIAEAAYDLAGAHTLLRTTPYEDRAQSLRHAGAVVRARDVLISWAGR